VSTSFLTSTPIWTRRIANELWSGPVTPLTYALLAEPMAEHMVRRPLRTAGLAGLAELPVFRRHASHVYVNAALLSEVVRRLPAALRSEGLLGFLPPTARAGLGPGASWLTGGAEALAIAARAWRNEPDWAPWARSAAFDRECVEVRRGFQNWGTFGAKPSPAELCDELVRVAERLGHYLDVVSWGMVFAYVFFHLLHELCRRWAPHLADDAAALTVGLPGIASLEAHHDLRAATPLFRAEPAIAAALTAGDFRGASAILADHPGRAGQALRDVLRIHGHRLSGRDLACPTWNESPHLVVELAASGANGGTALLDRAAAVRRRLAATTRLEDAIGQELGGIGRRAIFRLVLAQAQRYYAVRENMRYHADFFLARLRMIARAFGAELVTAGRVDAVDDVFWLDVEEMVHAATATGGEPADLRATIALRRASGARDAERPPPETLDEPASSSRGGTDGELIGEIGAPGRAVGTARIVTGPDDFERVRTGDVLIAVYTDPGWTTVLERAAGLVLEAGGILSHGAIVARELGIPALVGVAEATRAVHDGDEVEVDAVAGRLRVVTPARA